MIKLLLPILFPSWRFFSGIGPSPRFDIGFIKEGESDPATWIDLSQIPAEWKIWKGIGQLFHNPVWNDQLYINTCAEHLFEFNSEFREQEIADRLLRLFQLKSYKISNDVSYFCFRIRAIESDGLNPAEKIVFFSKIFPLDVKKTP